MYCIKNEMFLIFSFYSYNYICIILARHHDILMQCLVVFLQEHWT